MHIHHFLFPFYQHVVSYWTFEWTRHLTSFQPLYSLLASFLLPTFFSFVEMLNFLGYLRDIEYLQNTPSIKLVFFKYKYSSKSFKSVLGIMSYYTILEWLLPMSLIETQIFLDPLFNVVIKVIIQISFFNYFTWLVKIYNPVDSNNWTCQCDTCLYDFMYTLSQFSLYETVLSMLWDDEMCYT